MADLVSLFARAVDGFGRRVDAIGDDQWTGPTPDTEWDVRTLTNHVLVEALWAPPLLDGLTIADVGARFDGDQLGEEPKAAWTAAATAAVAAASSPGALDRAVHVSFGDISGQEYITQLLCDHLIHGWDLARAIGADERLEPDLVEFATAYFEPQAGDWRAAGIFGPAQPVMAEADGQARLLALTGRRP
jgi:uncharacterized protein (TIGR03086 family)